MKDVSQSQDIAFAFPAANLLELKNCYRIDIPAPAFKNQEVSVSLNDKKLTITSRKNSSTDKVTFLRTVRVPESFITSEDFSYTYIGGIFSIKLFKPVAEKVKAS
ncbi:Hsp20/alpha crystallin family protein [Cytophagaceae bacterium ABcell3]|nr:Hsp20/alpha crystallin family protein [Cytophagaceae bacterium ABcell3]